jgi:polyisoprenoid-binding protein YceI
MQAPTGQLDTPTLQSWLRDGTLAGQWVLDPARSSIRLRSTVIGLIPVSGEFREITGAGTVGPDGTVSGILTVAAASIDTRNSRRDTHLRSADFLGSDDYPDITFTAAGVRPAGPGATVTGALTVRGQTRPLSVDVAVSVRGDGEIQLDTGARINRADFGLTWNVLGLASLHSTLTVHAVFTRP